jgi:hypothetical protein
MALEGSLRDLSLIDLLHLFRIGLKTGVLRVFDGVDQDGAVYVRAGGLIDAVLVRGPERQVIATADDAVIRLLQWEAARFTFQPDLAIDERPVRMVHDHAWLLREASRLRERSAHGPPVQAITLDTCFALSRRPGVAPGAFKLDLEQWRILSQVAVSPSARALCSRGMEPDQALAGLAQLLALGLVEFM